MAIKIKTEPREPKHVGRDRLRNIQKTYGVGKTLLAEDQELVIMTILRYGTAQDRVTLAKGVKSVVMGKKRHVALNLMDGTTWYPSYRIMFKHKSKGLLAREQLRRKATKDLCYDFKIQYFNKKANPNGQVPCMATGKLIHRKEAEVDHLDPGFAAILTNFLKHKNMTAQEVLDDETNLTEWLGWHREKATLQVVSSQYHQHITRLRAREAKTRERPT